MRGPADPVRRFALLGSLAPLALAACGRKPAPAPAPASQPPPPPQPQPLVQLQIATNGDLLEFKPKELTCHAGDHVQLTFRNTGKYVNFEHNWVLLTPHSFDEVTAAALVAGEEHGWVPPGDQRILAATPLCSRGHAVVADFIAPAAGDYLFICTVPGHAESMWGVLHVLPGGGT